MQPMFYLTILFVASAAVSAVPSQSSEQQQASNTAPVSVGQSQGGSVVANSPVAGASPVESSQPASVEQPPHHHAPSSYYAPAGLINVVGSEQTASGVSSASGANGKPIATVRSFTNEQYGQPESASLPPNYKPFGSWGLYIGGNPADGYYTNYYKAFGNSVEKQQQSGAGEQVGVKPVIGQAAFSPVLKQVGAGSPQVGSSDYYSFAYSPSDLNSGVMQPVQPIQASGAQVYSSPVTSYESGYGVSPYADAYATKKLGAVYSQKELKEAQPLKGYQSRVYVYPSGVLASPIGPMSASAQSVGSHQQQHQHQHQHSHQQPQHQQAQVVSYPVPVGSQIVGSQPGVEGSFSPYGVHGFTRYALKPTMVSQDPSYYYGAQSSAVGSQQIPSYKQHQQQAYYSGVQSSSASPTEGAYYPMSFYGYPMNQLHYSQGSIVPSVHSGEPHYGPMASPQVESISEKSENEDKSINKHQ